VQGLSFALIGNALLAASRLDSSMGSVDPIGDCDLRQSLEVKGGDAALDGAPEFGLRGEGCNRRCRKPETDGWRFDDERAENVRFHRALADCLTASTSADWFIGR
jgi:hypothetical protein